MKPLSYIRVSVPLCETLMFPDGLDCRLLSLLQYFGLSHWGKFVGRYTLCASIIIPEIFFFFLFFSVADVVQAPHRRITIPWELSALHFILSAQVAPVFSFQLTGC